MVLQGSLFDPPARPLSPLPAAPENAFLAPPERVRQIPRASVDPCGHLEACGGSCGDCEDLQEQGFCRCLSCPHWQMADSMYPAPEGPICSACQIQRGGEVDGR